MEGVRYPLIGQLIFEKKILQQQVPSRVVLIHNLFIPLALSIIKSIVFYVCHVEFLLSVRVQRGQIIGNLRRSLHQILSISPPLVTVVLHQLIVSEVLWNLQDHIF